MPWKGLVLNTEATNYNYLGLSGSLNQNITLWNAAVGYKFLKNNAASLTLQFSDIFRTRLNSTHSESKYFAQDYDRRRDPQVLRLNFNWRFGKIVAGVLTWAASGAGTFPAATVNNRVASGPTVGGAQLNGMVKGQGHKVGTFTTDAEVIAATSVF